MGGRKSFSPGDILQAADVQDFLMDQSVMVFGGTAARGSGIASPTEGMISYRTDADALEVYTGTAWVPAAQAAGAATVTNRNLLYNGAMQVSQRGTSTTGITAAGYYTADRWCISNDTLGTWTQSVENDAPTGSGLRKSLKMLCTTADASPAAADVLQVFQALEGQDIQRIAKGTASAQRLTVSFWVKSNVTGTYIVYLYDNDNNRQVCASYSISASATWEKKTITFPADTTGAFDNDNGHSLSIYWALAMGSNRTSGTLQTTWATYTAANNAPGQTNLAAATNNYWQVTGVQLEVGDAATDFEFKSYGQELRECQRYYYRISPIGNRYVGYGYNLTTTTAAIGIPFPVPLRADPAALEQSGTAAHYNVAHGNTSTACSAVPAFNGNTSSVMATLVATVASGLTAGQGSALQSTSSGYLAWSAEL